MRRPTPLPADTNRPATPAESIAAPAPALTPPLRRASRPAGEPPREPGQTPSTADAEARGEAAAANDSGDANGTDTANGTGASNETNTSAFIAAKKPPVTAPGEVDPSERGARSEGEAPTGLREVWRAARARRRVLRSEVRRFTVRSRRRRIGWLVAAASMIALVVATLVIAYSPLFAVEKIVIEGAVRLDAATLESAVGDQLGRPLPRVDESEIKAALVKFPMVESYQIEARPPHELLVRVVERTPIGVLQGPAGFSLVDGAGVVLETTPERPAGAPLLQISGGTSSAAFESAGLVMRALPDSIRARVTGVTATTRDDVTLLLGDANASIVWGSVEDSALKALVLETAMQQMPPEGVVSYDVSSPGAIVIR